MKKIMFLLLPIILLFSACEEEIFENETFESSKKVSVYGKVTNKEGTIVVGAKVNLSGYETYTNNLGLYLFKDIILETEGAFLKVTSEEYFTGGRIIRAKDNSVNQLNVKLLRKENGGSFNASNGGELNLGNTGAKVSFNTNGIVDEDNQTYNGNVEVYYTLIKTDDSDFEKILPGGLSAINSDEEEVVLESYGMLGIELLGLGGESLNLGNGKTATITIPVAPDQLSSAPSTIPLWHLNEQTGLWEEEGEAILQGDKYVGEVSHFSFWNCDYPNPVVELTFQIVDENNNPIVNYPIKASINDGGIIAGGSTDGNGFVIGLFPKDETIRLYIDNSNACTSLGYELDMEVGAFQEDTDLGIISVTVAEESTSNISGVIGTNCATEGEYFLIIHNESATCQWEYFLSDDNFDVDFLRNIASNYTAVIYDITNTLSSETFMIEEGGNDLGTVNVCEEVDQYVKMELDGEYSFFIQENFLGVYSDSSSILLEHIVTLGGTASLWMVIIYEDENDKLNTSSVGSLTMNNHENNISLDCYWNGVGTNDCDEIIELTEFGGVGEYIAGTISGEMYSSSDGNIHPYSLEFRLKIWE